MNPETGKRRAPVKFGTEIVIPEDFDAPDREIVGMLENSGAIFPRWKDTQSIAFGFSPAENTPFNQGQMMRGGPPVSMALQRLFP
jgi:hypothetical protein